MTWQEVRELFPKQWVVVEALDAKIEGERRIVNNLKIAAVCGDDSRAVMEKFLVLSRSDRQREYYPVSTERENLDIHVRASFGRISS